MARGTPRRALLTAGARSAATTRSVSCRQGALSNAQRVRLREIEQRAARRAANFALERGRFVFQPGEVRSLWGTVTHSVIHVMALGAAGCITKATVEAFEAAGVVGGLLETAIAKLQLVLVADTANALVIHHRESAKLLLSQGAPGGGAPASPGAPRVVTVDPP